MVFAEEALKALHGLVPPMSLDRILLIVVSFPAFVFSLWFGLDGIGLGFGATIPPFRMIARRSYSV